MPTKPNFLLNHATLPNTADSIRENLRIHKTPILDFELGILRDELAGFGVEQDELSRLLGEAMEQSSETWHDNAPADAINERARMLVPRAEFVIAAINTAVLIEYPTAANATATLGSIVEVRYPRDTEESHILLTGVCRALPAFRNREAYAPNLEVVTFQSPLGDALFGQEAGSHVNFTAGGGRSIAIEMGAITQLTAEDLEA